MGLRTLGPLGTVLQLYSGEKCNFKEIPIPLVGPESLGHPSGADLPRHKPPGDDVIDSIRAGEFPGLAKDYDIERGLARLVFDLWMRVDELERRVFELEGRN